MWRQYDVTQTLPKVNRIHLIYVATCSLFDILYVINIHTFGSLLLETNREWCRSGKVLVKSVLCGLNEIQTGLS